MYVYTSLHVIANCFDYSMDAYDICNNVSLTISLRFRYVIRQNGGDSGRTFVQKPMERLTFCYDKVSIR